MGAVATLGFVAALFAFSQHGIFPDDAYITWRYARNVALGRGLVYNPGERYLGTSGPGYALLLGALGALTGVNSIIWWSEVIAALSLFASAIGLLAIFWNKDPIVGVVSGLLYITLPLVRPALGFEIVPELALVIWACHFYLRSLEQRKSAMMSAATLALATVIRPDAVLYLIPLIIHSWSIRYQWHKDQVLWRRILKAFPLQEATLVSVFIGSLLLITRWYYGLMLPSSFYVKVAQQSSFWGPFLLSGLQSGIQTALALDLFKWSVIFALIGATTLLSEYREGNRALMLLLSAVASHFLFYTWKLPGYGWYYVPEGLGIALLAAVAIRYVIRFSTRRSRYLALAVGGLGCYFTYGLLRDDYQTVNYYAERIYLYGDSKPFLDLGTWLKANTAPHDSIGLWAVGATGWSSDRPIVDQFFLVSPGDYESISRKVYDSAYKTHKPTVIVENPQLFDTMQGHPWFQQDYEYWTGFPTPRSTPITKAESDELKRRGQTEFDLWRRRVTPLSRAEANARAKQAIALMDRDRHRP